MLNNVLIVANKNKDKVKPILQSLIKELKKRNITSYTIYPAYYTLHDNDVLTDFDDHYRHRKYDIIFTIGGDGTYLYTARTFATFEIPIVGINAGRLGFLMETLPETIPTVLDKLCNEEIGFRDRLMLEVFIMRGGKSIGRFYSFNDVVISKGEFARMVDLEIFTFDEVFANPKLVDDSNGNLLSRYRADGVIISTPVGSTAYNLSAGGPIIMPSTAGYVVTPISPHTLGVRPVMLSSDRSLSIRISTGHELFDLSIDGQENVVLYSQDRVLIRKSDFNIKMFYLGDDNYFRTLREKLGWHI